MLDNPVILILALNMLFLVVWMMYALSLNMRDAHKRKRLQQARQQARAPETVPVEQVIRLTGCEMQQWKPLQQARQQEETPETVPVEQVIRLAEWEMQQWKPLQQARQQDETSETVPVEQVIRLAEWEMQQWIGEGE